MKYTEIGKEIINIEIYVRSLLGQIFTKYDKTWHEKEHLKFNMSDNVEENNRIWKLFEDILPPLNVNNKCNYHCQNYIFIFHKGCGKLYKIINGEYNYDSCIEEYGGYGTVDILVDLICRIGNYHQVNMMIEDMSCCIMNDMGYNVADLTQLTEKQLVYYQAYRAKMKGLERAAQIDSIIDDNNEPFSYDEMCKEIDISVDKYINGLK